MKSVTVLKLEGELAPFSFQQKPGHTSGRGQWQMQMREGGGAHLIQVGHSLLILTSLPSHHVSGSVRAEALFLFVYYMCLVFCI